VSIARQRVSVSDVVRNADVVVVGAGLFGLTVAERAATQMGARVVVIDKREHIGGNAYSAPDPETGIEVHRYGTHVFHTSKPTVWEYVNRFARFNDYRHSVVAVHGGRAFSMPINLGTICAFFGRLMTPDEARALIASQADRGDREGAASLESKAVSSIGRPLYEAFVRGYTTKQWGRPPSELPASIIARLPVRFTFDSRYFSDRWEGIPVDGYGSLARAMADDRRIVVALGCDFADVRAFVPPGALTVYTGPLDSYFGFAHGRLSWRTLRFEQEVVPTGDFQGAAVVNYVDEDVPYTRIHEFRHLDPAREVARDRSVIFREFSHAVSEGGDPYYPVGSADDRRMLHTYRERAAREKGVLFGGRLGSYAYLDMDMAISSALGLFERSVRPWLAAKGGAA
jgi:UDP-galactopyranose mutase